MKLTLSSLFFTCSFCLLSTQNYAQIGIGTTTPHTSAILDITSTNKGLLPPRMTTVERNQINSNNPSQGLMVYNTDDNCLQIYNNSTWVDLCGNSNTGSTPSFNSQVTGTIGGNYPGYALTNVFQNIKFPKSELISFHQENGSGVFYIGGNRKKIYTNNGAVYSAKENFREFMSLPKQDECQF